MWLGVLRVPAVSIFGVEDYPEGGVVGSSGC